MSDNKNKAEFNENGMEDIEELKTESVNNEAAEEVKDEPLKEIIKAKEEELNELNSRFMRLQADFINHKRRTENEKENSISDGIEFVMRDLLPIIDNFQRALESEVDKEDGFYKGISMIEQQLFDLLKNYSVMEIDCLGKAFDPNYHDAVFMEESDKYEPGMITEVLQKGYKLKEKHLERLEIVGTLERPVHAMNLDTYQTILKIRYPKHVVVAVDASVGNMEHIGYVTLGKGALKPGLGVSKELKAVGDIFITGIVGSCGNYDPLMLQSIRLSVVMRMADCISHSIYLVEKLWENTAFL